MLNKIILVGRMTKDPETRGKDPEKPIAYFRLAVDRDYKREGEPTADYFDCSVFGQQAKFVLQYGRKGRLCAVSGAMQHREWQDQQTGEKRTVFEVVRADVHFLDKKPEDATAAAPQQAAPAPMPAVAPTVSAAPAVGYAPTQAYAAPAQAAVTAPQAAPAPVMQAQPVATAVPQYGVPDFSGVPESYAFGAGGVPVGNTPF